MTDHIGCLLFIAFFILSTIEGYSIRGSPIWTNSVKQSRLKLYAKPVHKVTIIHNGKEYNLNCREDESILNAALDANIELPYDCNMGVCLTCPSKVVSGIVDQSEGTLDTTVTDKGYALTCVTYPRSDVVIKSIEEDELVIAQFSRDS
eukprot:gene10162-13670_t